MTVRQWLRKRRAQLDGVPRLEDALLGASPQRYAVYRLKYVFVRAMLRTVFRLLELALFVSAFSFDILGPVLWVRSVMLVGEALWWGALETLRRDVRQLAATGTSPSTAIRQWLALACAAATLVMAAAGAWLIGRPAAGPGISVLDVFVLGCSVRWAVDLLARTYHSGVYGVRRVYRPLWSLLLVDVADIGVFVLAYWWLGAWGLGISFAAVGLLRAVLSYSFTRRVYARLKISVGSPRFWFRSLKRARWSVGHSVRSALGNLVAQVDALLVLGLLAAPGNEAEALRLAALFHGVAPLQAAAFSWSRLFYFDFKRLEAWGSPLLLKRFESFVSHVALWVPAPIGLVTWGLLAAMWKGPYWLLSAELLALAAVRARLSLLHIRAYSLSDHRFLAKLFFGMLLVASVTPLLGQLPADLSLGAVVSLAAFGLVLLGRSSRPLTTAAASSTFGVSIWIRLLCERSGPVYIGLVRVDRRMASVGRVMRALAPALPGAAFARLSKDSFAWFQAADDSMRGCDVGSLVALGAGTLREVRVGPCAGDGTRALTRGVASPAWERYIGRYLRRSSEATDLANVRASLRAVVPGGHWVELAGAEIALDVAGTSTRQIRRLVLDAARGRTGFRRFEGVDVAVLAPAGLPVALVVVPADASRSVRWRAEAAELLKQAEISMTWNQQGPPRPAPLSG